MEYYEQKLKEIEESERRAENIDKWVKRGVWVVAWCLVALLWWWAL